MRDVRAALDAAEREQERIAESALRWEGRYSELIKALRRDAVVFGLGSDGEIVESQGPVEELLGIDGEELGKRFEDIVDEAGRQALADGNTRLRDGWAETARCEAVFSTGGEERTLSLLLVAVCDREGAVVDVEAIAGDRPPEEPSAPADAEATDFDALLLDASRRLLETPGEAAFEKSLADVGQYFSLDRVVVNAYDEESRKFSVLAAWYGEGVDPLPAEDSGLSISELPWAYSILSAGESIAIGAAAELPSEASAEKKLYANKDVRSALLAPLVRHDHLAGFVSLQTTTADRVFDEVESANVRRFVATLSVALAHAEMTEELEQAYRDADEADQRVASSAGELEELREAADKAREELSATSKASDEAQARLEKLEKQLQERDRLLEEAERNEKKAAESADRKADDAKRAAEQKAKEAVEQAERKAEKAERKREKAERRAEKAEREAEESKQALERSRRDIEKELESAKSAAEKAERQREDARRTADEAVETAEVAAKATDEAERTLNELRRRADDAERAAASANEDAERARAAAEEASRDRDTARNEVRDLRREIDSLRATAEATASTAAGLAGFDPDATVEMERTPFADDLFADESGSKKEWGDEEAMARDVEAARRLAREAAGKDAVDEAEEFAADAAEDDNDEARDASGVDDRVDGRADDRDDGSVDEPLGDSDDESDRGWVRGKLARWTSSKKSEDSSWEEDTGETAMPNVGTADEASDDTDVAAAHTDGAAADTAAASDERRTAADLFGKDDDSRDDPDMGDGAARDLDEAPLSRGSVSALEETIADGRLEDFDILEDPDEQPGPLVDPDLAGVDVEAGIAEVGGNEELYRDMLLKFRHDYRGAGDKIGAAIEKGNVEVAHLLLHSIKGVSGVLGASDVHRCADELESSLIQPDDSITRKDFEAFAKALEEVIGSIEAIDEDSLVASESDVDA